MSDVTRYDIIYTDATVISLKGSKDMDFELVVI